jgi:hypothetical protein
MGEAGRKGASASMVVFLCRRQNSDFSVVKARNEDEAIELLIKSQMLKSVR